MTQAKTGPGGAGRHVTHSQCPKVEPVPSAINIGAVSRLGSMQGVGTPYKPLFEGRGYSTPVGPTSNMGVGPGANRDVHRSGSQGQHGAPARGNPRELSTDIFESFPGTGPGKKA
jgi:hypothetical protein